MIPLRLRREEGMALGLAIIMVVVIGVMGAGLLTFISSDLRAVATVNRGEQAFELAEAGIEVAKAHLATAPGPSGWSSGQLSMSGMAENSLSATIERDAADGSFVVVSTGQYGQTRRKIEAVFRLRDGKPQLLGWRELYE